MPSVIIYSSAIKEENPILTSARASGKLLLRRAEALAAIMRGKRGIIIAGMHGKTTTSAMTAHVLREGGLHPSHYVGAEIPILGSERALGCARRIFRGGRRRKRRHAALFHPEHALILNIEEEHLDFYADLAAIEEGLCASCSSKPAARFFIARTMRTRRAFVEFAHARPISFGFAEKARLSRHRTSSCRISRRSFVFVSAARKAGRSHSERSGPAQREQRARRDRARHRAGNSLSRRSRNR